MGYLRETIKGVSWMAALKVAVRGTSFLRIAILARLLSQKQFGVFGIAGLVLVFMEKVTETGINVILIQEKLDLKKHINTAWIVSIIRGFLMFLIILVLSPFVSVFFDSPESLNLLILISFVPLIRGFINPSTVKFRKELEFQKEFLFKFVLFFIDAFFAIVAAFITRSAESLVIGVLVSAVFELAISHLLVLPRPEFKYETRQVRRIFSRGKWVTISEVMEFLSTHFDDIVVGKILNAFSLGGYQMAYRISELPLTEVTQVVGQVTFPVYSKISREPKRLKKAFLKTLLVTSFFSTFLGLVIFVFAKPFVYLVLGNQWLNIVGVLRILTIFGILKATMYSAHSLFFAVKKQKYVTKIVSLNFLVLLITIIPFVKSYGLEGAGISAVISIIFTIPLVVYYVNKIFKKYLP